MSKKFHVHRPHPWHGLEAGRQLPEFVNAYIEITPFDQVKYELDKESGFLMVDRPFPHSSQNSVLYGFIPKTYCGDRVRDLCEGATVGDGDPLDICVLSERPVRHNDILVKGRVVGGMTMIDCGEADDKIIAVIEKDPIWGNVTDISELPSSLIDRIRHYFMTYKGVPGEAKDVVRIDSIYGLSHAKKVVEAALEDYQTYMKEEE